MRFKILPIVSVILKKDDHVFLIRCGSQGAFPGVYTLVGGHVDGQETFTQAVIREAQEEIGIEIKADDLKLIHVNNRKRYDGQEIIWLIFVTDKWQGTPVNKEMHKHDEIGFYPINKLPENVKPEFLEEVFNNLKGCATYGESGW